MRIRLLLLGAEGLLGSEIRQHLDGLQEFEILAPNRTQLDITNTRSLDSFLVKYQPTTIVNCAGYTDVEAAELDHASAIALNVTPLSVLSKFCSSYGARLFHFSTDYVFGEIQKLPIDVAVKPNPLNFYGVTKELGEKVIGNHLDLSYSIIRTSWLFGLGKENFVSKMYDRALRGIETNVVDDQVGSPTHTSDIAFRLGYLLSQPNTPKTIHIVGEGEATWFDVANSVFTYLKVPNLLHPIASSELGLVAQRPKYSYLKNSNLQIYGIPPMPFWQDSVTEYLDNLKQIRGGV